MNERLNERTNDRTKERTNERANGSRDIIPREREEIVISETFRQLRRLYFREVIRPAKFRPRE